MTNKNILIAIDSLAAGGAEKSNLTLAEELVRMGHNVWLMIFENVVEYPVPADVELILLPWVLKKNGRIDRAATADAVDAEVAKLETSSGRLHLILSNLPNTDSVFSLVKRDNIYFSLRNDLFAKEQGKHSWFKWFKKKRRYQKTYNGKNIISVSRGALTGFVEGLGVRPRNQVVSYSVFDIDLVRARAKDDDEVDVEDFLLHIGSFKRQKRHDRVLQAYALSGIDKPLVLMGREGNLKREVQAQIELLGLQGRVIFRDFTQNPYAWMARAHMLVLGSDYEGLPRVVIESLIAGTPVASVRCPSGPEEILVDGLEVGLSDISAEGLAAAMRRVLEAPPVIKESHLYPYTVEAVVSKYLALCG